MRISRFEFSQLHDFRPRADNFALDEIIEEMQQEAVVEPPKPSYDDAQLSAAKEAARKEGYAEGYEAAQKEISAETLDRERNTLQTLERIEAQLLAKEQSYERLLENETRDISQFILIVARKIAGDALKNSPQLAVQELLMQCLPIVMNKPRVIIDIPEGMETTLAPHLAPYLERAGFEGEVQLRANAELTPGDAIVEWVGGRAVRDNESMWKDIERMINQLSFAPTQEPHLATTKQE